MNILFFSNIHISPNRGGVERVTYTLSNALKERGHNITLLSATAPIDRDILRDNQYILPQKETYKHQNILYTKKLIQDKNIDIIVNQSETLSSHMLLNEAKGKCPQITCIHTHPADLIKSIRDNWDLWISKDNYIKRIAKLPYYLLRCLFQYYIRQKFLRHKYSRIYNESDNIILLSERYKKSFTEYARLSNDNKLHYIQNPNTYNKSQTVEKENLVLFVGRLEYSPKRADRIIDVWNIIEKQNCSWQLKILGDGPDRESLELMAHKYGLRNISFEGIVDPFIYYKKAKIICGTSTTEGYPMVILEAIQNNIIPIVFDSYEATHDIIEDKKTGFLIRPFRIKEYAKTLLMLMNNNSLLTEMQNNIIEKSKTNQFDIDNTITKWEELFKKICFQG